MELSEFAIYTQTNCDCARAAAGCGLDQAYSRLTPEFVRKYAGITVVTGAIRAHDKNRCPTAPHFVIGSSGCLNLLRITSAFCLLSSRRARGCSPDCHATASAPKWQDPADDRQRRVRRGGRHGGITPRDAVEEWEGPPVCHPARLAPRKKGALGRNAQSRVNRVNFPVGEILFGAAPHHSRRAQFAFPPHRVHSSAPNSKGGNHA